MQVITICTCVLLFFTISNIAEVVEIKKNDTIVEKSTSNVTEERLDKSIDSNEKVAETNSTVGEVQDDNNETLNVKFVDESFNSQNETSEDNPKKRHVYPLPTEDFQHPYLDNQGTGQRLVVASNPAPLPTYVNYNSYSNRGYADTIPGNQLQDYPILSSVPETGFTCQNKEPGLYGDIVARCQVWHFCQPDGRKDSFLCPNGTLFNQRTLVCEWWFNVECGVSSETGSSQYPGGSSVRYQTTTTTPPSRCYCTKSNVQYTTTSLPPRCHCNRGSYGSLGTRRPITYFFAPVTPSSYPVYSDVETATQPTKKPPTGRESQWPRSGYFTSSQTINVRPAKPYPTTTPQIIYTVNGGYGNVEGGDQQSSGGDGQRGDSGYGVPIQTEPSVPTYTTFTSYGSRPRPGQGKKSGYQYPTQSYSGQPLGYQYQTGGQYPVQSFSGQKYGYPHQTGGQSSPPVRVIYVPQCGRCQSFYPNSYPIDYRNAYSGDGTPGSNPNPQYPLPGPAPIPEVPSTPPPSVTLRPPTAFGTKSDYQNSYSYSTQIGGQLPNYIPSYSDDYGERNSGYPQPVAVAVPISTPVPRVVPTTQRPANTKSDYQYTFSGDLSGPGSSYQQTFSAPSSDQKGDLRPEIGSQDVGVQGSRSCAHCYIPSGGSSGSSAPDVPTAAAPQNPVTASGAGDDDDSEPQVQY